MKHSFSFLVKGIPIFFLLVGSLLYSQEMYSQVKITGEVVDQQGEALIGVTIIVKETKQGTVSDIDGKFVLDVPSSNSVLKFTYVGYSSKEVKVGDQLNMKVVMSSNSVELDELVVVGYGTQRKASLIGSLSSVKADEITKAPTANISQALVGKLPGLVTNQASGLPGADEVAMYVRGFGSLNNNAPLVLVDGVERSFQKMDPSEIESVTILKDAAAAAVYGVRGATGVVLVTTKRGKEGKPKFTYSGSYTLSESTRMPKYLNGEEYVKWYNYADKINGRAHTFTDDVVNKVVNGDPNGIYGNTNWLDLMLKSTAPTQQHNISLRGGNENVKYFMSLGYLNQEGIIKGVDYSRYNLRSNIDANVTKDFSVGLDIGASVDNSNSPQISNFTGNGNSVSTNLMNQITVAPPYINAMAPDGKYLTSSLQSGNNPLAARDMSGYNNSDNTWVQSSLTLKYNTPFVEGLSFKVVGSYDKNFGHTKSFYTPYNLWTVNPSSTSSTLNKVAAPYGTLALLSERNTQATRWTVQEFINYNKTFNEKHAVDALLLAEQSHYNQIGLGASAQDFDLTDLSEFGFAKENPKKPTGSNITTNRLGWVGRFNYTYDNKYLVEFSGRVDASTNFPKENRFGFFPSVSAGWRVSEEKFFQNWETPINNLKLTASHGILGNDYLGNGNTSYEYLRFMTVSTNPVAYLGTGNVNGMYTTSVPNKDLTWEKVQTTNVGFDLEMWHGLLGVEFNAFYKLTTDILTSVSGIYPPSIGGYYPNTVNSGKVDNRGLEVTIRHQNKVNDFSYFISGSVGWAHNRILNMNQSVGIPEYQSLIGKSLGAKTGLIALGLFQSDAEAMSSPVVNSSARAGDIKYKDLNNDGKITYDQDVTIIGRSNVPELTFSFNYSSSWRNFELSFLIQGAAIADNALMGMYEGIGWDDTQYTRPFYGGNTPRYLVKDSWSPDNTSGKYPRLDNQWRPNNNWASSLWIVDGSYVRLKNVQLAYNLPKSLKKKIGAEAKIFVAGVNLITLSAFDYLDPEAPSVSNGYYPQQKTYSLGVSLTF